MDFPVVKFPPIPKPSYRGMNRSSSIPDQWILVDEEATRGERERGRERERERGRERESHVDRVSLPQGPLVSNLLRFQKIVRPGWLFDVVGMTLTKRKKKKKKKEKERKGKGEEEKGKEEGNAKKDRRDG